MNILGINDHHNSSVALLSDGKLVCAMQEERFTRKKNFWGMPKLSIQAVLDYAAIKLKDIDLIVLAGQRHSAHVDLSRDEHLYLMKQFVQMDLFDALRGRMDIPVRKILKRKIQALAFRILPGYFYNRQSKKMKKERLALLHSYYPETKKNLVRFIDHHDCHFATALFGAGKPDGKRLIFTNDGQGDSRCGSVTLSYPDGHRENLSSINDRDSIAQFWALITLLTGFVPLEHEYKLMGMAPYSLLSRRKKIAESFENLFIWENGRYRLKNQSGLHSFHIQHLIDAIQKLCKFQRFDDICGGLQLFTEKAFIQWIGYWVQKTGVRDIGLSGGTFMNVKVNLEIMKMPEVRSVFVFPSCGDETNAIGACYQAYYEETKSFPEALETFHLGKNWTNKEITNTIQKINKDFIEIERYENIEKKVAELLASNHIVARFKGREEFGARALGNRSILANPSHWSVVTEINDMIKQRDFWMPFACSMLEEDQMRYIQQLGKNCGQYMIMCYNGGPEVNTILAGAHPRDKTIRPQVVSQKLCPDYYALISHFKDLTGLGAILNTSFNLHGFPLVHSPEDALYVFEQSGLKHLALDNYILKKKEAIRLVKSNRTESAAIVSSKVFS